MKGIVVGLTFAGAAMAVAVFPTLHPILEVGLLAGIYSCLLWQTL